MTKTRLPVVLLGGLDIVRALGLAKIPAIIASSERRTPSMASRYCAGSVALPPLSERKAYVEALAQAGRRLAAQHRARLPPFFDHDEPLGPVQDLPPPV